MGFSYSNKLFGGTGSGGGVASSGTLVADKVVIAASATSVKTDDLGYNSTTDVLTVPVGGSLMFGTDVGVARSSTGVLGAVSGSDKASFTAGNVTASGLAAPGAPTVTPTLTKIASITVVAGASLVDGDYFTVDDGGSYVYEFDNDSSVTPGRIAIPFTGAETANEIRDLCIIAINLNNFLSTAISGGAATVSLSMNSPGAAGGTLTENVANAGFSVTGFSNPTAATTYTYRIVAKLSDGTVTEAGTAGTTAAGVATLSATNYNYLTWSAVLGAAGYDIYRTVGGATQGKIGSTTTAVNITDNGLVGDGGTAPVVNGTGLLAAKRVAVTGGTLATDGTAPALSVTATLPASPSAAVSGISATVTSAGSAAQEQRGLTVILDGTYSGDTVTAAIAGDTRAPGNNGLLRGVYGVASSVGSLAAGVGVHGSAVSGNQRYGVYGTATAGVNAAIGGTFTLGSLSVITGVTSALLADNGSVAAPIFLARDNGNTKFSILDGGAVKLEGATVATDGTIPALGLTATLPASPSAAVSGISATVTSAGSAAYQQLGSATILLDGYTGSRGAVAVSGITNAKSTGTSWAATVGSPYLTTINAGVEGRAAPLSAAGSSFYAGVVGTSVAASSSTNLGQFGGVFYAGYDGPSVGSISVASGVNAKAYGAMAYLGSMPSTVPAGRAALMADNTDQAQPIALFRDNGATKVSIEDGGALCGNSTKTLTESSATGFVEIAVASGAVASAEIDYEVEANDATDYQVLSGTIRVNGVNKGGTVTANIAEVGSQLSTLSTGTLTVANTVTAGTGKFTVEANAVSSLTQTTLRIKYLVRSAKPITVTGL